MKISTLTMAVIFLIGVIRKVNSILLGTIISLVLSMKNKNTHWSLFGFLIMILTNWDLNFFYVLEEKAIYVT